MTVERWRDSIRGFGLFTFFDSCINVQSVPKIIVGKHLRSNITLV